MRNVLSAAVAALLLASPARGELRPDEIVLVAVKGSPLSTTLAEHYAKARGVPPGQILYLAVARGEELPRRDWDETLRPAIRQWLKANKLDDKVRCFLTCGDVPLKIGRRDPGSAAVVDRRKFLLESREARVAQVNAQVRLLGGLAVSGPGAIVDVVPLRPDAPAADVTAAAESALKAAQQRVQTLEADKQRGPAGVVERIFLAGGGINALLRSVASRAERGPLPAETQQRLELFRGQMQGLQEGVQAMSNLPDTISRDLQLMNLLQRHSGVLGAIQWIDAELESLDKNETYSSFDSELSLVAWPDYPLFRWQPNLLHYSYGSMSIRRSTLMVSRLAAPTVELAKKLVDAAIAAEKEGPKGKVYLDARGINYDPKTDQAGSYGQFDQSLRDLAARLKKHTGLAVVLDDKPALFAPGACPEAALYCGWYSLGNYIDSFTWQPGAIGYHLASMEAQTVATPGSKVWCNAMLERGVAATLGPAYEPYLLSFPLPDDFFSLLLTGRHTLAEAYFRTAPFASWVMVLVGDPLYNPFRNNPLLNEDALPERLRQRSIALPSLDTTTSRPAPEPPKDGGP